jgi:hypothetical protein
MIIFRTEERLCDGCCYKQGEFRLIFKDAVIHLCVDCLG